MRDVWTARKAISGRIEKDVLEHFGYEDIYECVNFSYLLRETDREDPDLYQRTKDLFHYIFSLGEEGKIFLWDKMWMKVGKESQFVEDLTSEEKEFLKSLIQKTQTDINADANNNLPIFTNRLEIAPYKNDEDREILSNSLVKNGTSEFENYTGRDYEEDYEFHYFTNNSLHFGIYLQGKIIGEVALDLKIGNSKRYNLSYYILPEHRKQGYISEVLEALIKEAFAGNLGEYRETLYMDEYIYEKVEVDVICISMSESNLASRKVAEKLGAHFDGVVKYVFEVNGVYDDNRYYSLVNPAVILRTR